MNHALGLLFRYLQIFWGKIDPFVENLVLGKARDQHPFLSFAKGFLFFLLIILSLLGLIYVQPSNTFILLVWLACFFSHFVLLGSICKIMFS